MLLHFGAVDWQAVVSVNGVRVAFHQGGFTPFVAEISHALRAGEEQRRLPRAAAAARSGAAAKSIAGVGQERRRQPRAAASAGAAALARSGGVG